MKSLFFKSIAFVSVAVASIAAWQTQSSEKSEQPENAKVYPSALASMARDINEPVLINYFDSVLEPEAHIKEHINSELIWKTLMELRNHNPKLISLRRIQGRKTFFIGPNKSASMVSSSPSANKDLVIISTKSRGSTNPLYVNLSYVQSFEYRLAQHLQGGYFKSIGFGDGFYVWGIDSLPPVKPRWKKLDNVELADISPSKLLVVGPGAKTDPVMEEKILKIIRSNGRIILLAPLERVPSPAIKKMIEELGVKRSKAARPIAAANCLIREGWVEPMVNLTASKQRENKDKSFSFQLKATHSLREGVLSRGQSLLTGVCKPASLVVSGWLDPKKENIVHFLELASDDLLSGLNKISNRKTSGITFTDLENLDRLVFNAAIFRL